jgi:integrase/recombinase XerD
LVMHMMRSDNPMTLIRANFSRTRLPKSLSETHVEALLNAPDLTQPLGVRDKTMLEVLYACGLRVSELVELQMSDVSLRDGVVRVIGKGDKQRLVPLGETACEWLAYYFEQARPALSSVHVNSSHVFLNRRGHGMTRQMFWVLIQGYAMQLGLEAQHISPHTLRHAFATHLLNHGADLRSVQMLLGHADISTTTIYTHVANQALVDLYRQHHPRGSKH